ncbi:MAG TPA: hypothetical protein VJ866_05195 [Pyrinomonadaceae bacterium]|nr:hypothetical protein [Pyrinomonadaceae bacterium]
MVKRTSHGESRHEGGERPTAEAARDKATAHEIYRDVESGLYVFVGPRGRTHVFTASGEHHTSFRTTAANRQRRLDEGKWERVGYDELPDKVK